MTSKIRKRHYFLAEVLISLALVIMAIFPLIHIHSQILKKESLIILETNCERIAENTYVEIKQSLYQGLLLSGKLKPLDNIERTATIVFDGPIKNCYFCKLFLELYSLKNKQKYNYEYCFLVEELL
jgi:hypothetical protein